MVAKKDLQGLSIDELEKFIQDADREMQRLRADKGRAHALLDAANAAAEAERKLSTMSDPERAALAQALGVDGIESNRSVGTPGN